MSFFGRYYKFCTFGESHSSSVGVIIENPLPKFELDLDKIQKNLNRRKPGQSSISTPRDEKDKLTVLSGMEIQDGKNLTLGSPICIKVDNLDFKKEDYVFDEVYIPRPGHSDYTYLKKYRIHASSGGGRSSARETISRCIAASVCEQFMENLNIQIVAWVSKIGHVELENFLPEKLTRESVDKFITRCPDEKKNAEMQELILQLKEQGDSIGGKVSCIIKNCPPGIGEPVFDKLEAKLAHAMMSIPACRGFEIGSGFDSCQKKGSEHNDLWVKKNDKFITETNFAGGINGGITNGMDIEFNVAFKPPSTICKPQKTCNINGDEVLLECKGRHDPCIVNRAVPIVESMSAVVLYDLILAQKMRM